MKVTWSSPALRHLDSIRSFIAADKPNAAARVAGSIVAAADQLENFPNLGRRGRIEGSRELIVPALPYIIAYRFGHEVIEIAGVIHTSRKWPEKL
jgi:plasmid stabilization system protein ParE